MKRKILTKLLPLLLIFIMLLNGCSGDPVQSSSDKEKDAQPVTTETPVSTDPGTSTVTPAGSDSTDTANTGDSSANTPDSSDSTVTTTPSAAPDGSDSTDTTTPDDSSSITPADSSDTALFSYEKNSDGTLTLTGYIGTESYVRIPSQIDGCDVTIIGESCFAGNIKAEKIFVPEGITALEDYAFECCSLLKKIYLPESLTRIGNGVFSGCCSLYLADLQDNVETIGDGAFLECTSLISFIAPKALRKVGAFAFANCTGLIKADFHDSALEAVSDRMFYFCGELSTVRLPEGISSIGVRAFSNNDGINYLYLPDSVKSIGAYAFEFCGNLQNFSVPCDTVEPYTFNSCTSLAYVSFPETLTQISVGAFKDTPLIIEELDIPATAQIAEGAFGHVQGIYEEGGDDSSDQGYAVSGPYDITDEEIVTRAEAAGFRTIDNAGFRDWAEEYLEYNKDNALLTNDLNPYIGKYKGEIGYYFKAMTAVASGVEAEVEAQKENFGEDFEDMYRMINHGLDTEMKRFRMKDDLLLYTGVYDFQLAAAAGTDHIPTLEELKNCIGKTFTDPCLTSTTTEASVAFGFSDTLFIIYAPAKNLNALGSVCMDSYLFSVENEILLCSGATYEIMDAGVMQGTLTEWSGEQHTECRNFCLLKLINE